MDLTNLSKQVAKGKKRVGRGYGSGKGGHTVGRGMKGQRSRSGFKKLRAWIRQSTILSLPKQRGIGKRSALRGYFKSKKNTAVVNVRDLNELPDNATVDRKKLEEQGIITTMKGTPTYIKILGSGELKKKLTVKNVPVSETAKQKIEKAGGKVL